jgi:hypothetical protein
VGLAQLLEGAVCLRSAKERFHVHVLQAEDGRAVALSVFISGFARREGGWENDGGSVRVEIIYRRRGA